MLVQGPIYAWFIVVACRQEPWAGGALVAWIGAAIAATWPHFPAEMVPEFVGDMRRTWAEVRGRVARRPWPEEAPTQARLTPLRLGAPAPATLSVLSANLWHDWPRGRRRHGGARPVQSSFRPLRRRLGAGPGQAQGPA